MAATTTTNTCKKCGCEDKFMPSPAPCPTPIGCPTPEPCSEVMDAQCVIYTGANILCDTDVVVTTNDTVAEALESIVDYICTETIVSTDIECDTDVVVESGTTVTDALVDIVDYFCNNTPAPGYTYEIGEYVESRGGVIFHRYKDGGQENYLVVDITDLSASFVLSNIDNVVIGPTAQTTWDGSSNTTAIITQSGATTGAAFLCDASSNGGQTDWYLPAIDELSLLWQNRFNVNRTLSGNSSFGIVLGADEINNKNYWSSTEKEVTNIFPPFNITGFVWMFNFGSNITGSYNTTDKSNLEAVRAVRKFSI